MKPLWILKKKKKVKSKIPEILKQVQDDPGIFFASNKVKNYVQEIDQLFPSNITSSKIL